MCHSSLVNFFFELRRRAKLGPCRVERDSRLGLESPLQGCPHLRPFLQRLLDGLVLCVLGFLFVLLLELLDEIVFPVEHGQSTSRAVRLPERYAPPRRTHNP